ncbi:MAG: CocE/NonD family hydrolase, partial [Candidatus Binatia bacterium]
MRTARFPAVMVLGVALVACGERSEVTPAGTASDRTSDASSAGADAAEEAAPVTQTVKFRTSDGVELHALLRGAGDLRSRPLIVEFSPYGDASAVPDFGPDYNHVFVHARGTGRSTGAWSAVGPRDQHDVAEFLEWACEQPWSDGRIGLYGFSASAIAVYNSMHLPLACVKAAALMAGTNALYRDLLYAGGILNVVPELVVGFGVGLPLLASVPFRMQEGQTFEPLEAGLALQLLAVDLLRHPTEDDYWLERTHRAGPNTFPVLANTGFYDVESRGPFQSYQMLRDLGVPVHLRVLGAHDGFPAGTPGPFPEYRR